MKNSTEQKGELTNVEINSCISVLEHLLQNGDQLIHLSEEQRLKLMKAAGQITRPDKAEIYKRNKSVKVARRQGEIADNRKARAATSIRSARTSSVFEAPSQIALPVHPTLPGRNTFLIQNKIVTSAKNHIPRFIIFTIRCAKRVAI